ncbi:tRNA-dihydrouridine synthase 4 [Saitozyma sp. JCM 24511]|nr:tRNA-dihydrouridine synthase 4 [Saitozyma sp. JCM 24511]
MTSELPSSWADFDVPIPPPQPVSSLLTNYSSPINVLAPLVRCGKLPFRHLCSLYETHVTYTPMILAQEFSRSQSARMADFTSSKDERGVFWVEDRRGEGIGEGVEVGSVVQPTIYGHPEDFPNGQPDLSHLNLDDPSEFQADSDSRPTAPHKTYYTAPPHTRLPPSFLPPAKHSTLIRGSLIAQFASPNPGCLADAAELVAPYVDGLDLNCGCPQRWAYNEGIGCALLRKPELVRDMVRAVKGRLGWGWPVSVKIRVDPDLKLTDQLVRSAISAGVSHITIHGRTRHQASTEPISLPAIRFAVESARGEVPCVGNGSVWNVQDAEDMRAETGVRGVMGARGLLANPALFAGYDRTPKHAVEQFVSLSVDYGLIFPLFHRHLAYMLESHFHRSERIYFNGLTSSVAAIDHLVSRGIDLEARHTEPIWDARRGRTLLK